MGACSTAAAIGLVATSLLTACSDDGSRSSGEDSAPLPTTAAATTQPTSAPPATPTPTEAVKQLDADGVRRAIAEEDTGTFSTTIFFAGVFIRRSGTYEIGTLNSESETEYMVPDQPTLTTRTRVVDQVLYLQLDNGSLPTMTNCWFAMPVDDLGDVRPGASPVDGVAFPAEVSVVLLADAGKGRRPRSTSDLFTTAGVLGSRLAATLDIDPDDTTRTPVSLRQKDNNTYEWKTTVGDIAASADAGGSRIPPEIAQVIERSSGSVGVVLDDVGVPVTIEAPAPRYRISSGLDAGPEESDAAVKACESL